jgi:hypothetical protein
LTFWLRWVNVRVIFAVVYMRALARTGLGARGAALGRSAEAPGYR